MLVKDLMTSDPVTVAPETPFPEAFSLMRERAFRRLPVVDRRGRLVGIVVEKDLLYASPSKATSLSVFELNYLLSRLQVKEIMSKPVITVEPDLDAREAAHMMLEKKFGALPVIQGGRLVGIITESDIFRGFMQG